MKSTWTQISKSISKNSFHLIQQISSFNPFQTTCSQFLFWISVPFRSRAMLYAYFAFWTLQQRPVQSFNKSIETMQKTHVFSEILGFMPSPWKFAEGEMLDQNHMKVVWKGRRCVNESVSNRNRFETNFLLGMRPQTSKMRAYAWKVFGLSWIQGPANMNPKNVWNVSCVF